MSPGVLGFLRPGSIRIKLTLLVAAIVAATAGLTFWFAYAQMSGDLRGEIDRRLGVIAQDRVETLRRHVDAQEVQAEFAASHAQLARVLALHADLPLSDSAFQRESWLVLDQARLRGKDIREVCLLDQAGVIRCSTNLKRSRAKVDAEFGSAVPPPDGSVGTVTNIDGHRAALIRVTIRGPENTFLGSLLVVCDFEPILKTLGELQGLGSSAEVRIGEVRGDTVEQFSPSMRPEPAPGSPLAPTPQEISVLKHVHGPDGRSVLAACRSVGSLNWQLAVLLDEAEAYAPVNELRDRLTLLFLGVLLVGWGAAFLLSRHFTRPILAIVRAAERIRAGELAAQVAVGSDDEIGRLSQTFNRMSVELERSYQTLEQRVRERTAELESVNQELSTFSHSVAHDLRAPLRAIAGYADILVDEKSGQLDPEAREMVARMRYNSMRLGKLIDDLLSFSGIGRRELHVEPVDPMLLVQDVLQDLQPEMAGRQVEIEVQELPPCVADAALLSLVFSNLLSNAIKYTRPRERAVVRVGCERIDGEQVYFVKDNGVGFDMRYAPSLFGLFQRLHGKSQFEGTGMGLAIVRRVVERHGGRIWAQAAVDQGATFSFTLQVGEPLPERERGGSQAAAA